MPCPAAECRVRQELAQARLDDLFASSAIPPVFRAAELEDFAGDEWLLKQVEVAERESRGLLITGQRGVGKTHLAVAVLKSRLARRRTGLFVEVPNLLDVIRATYRRDSETCESELLQAVQNVDCLVLDDLGVEVPTAWAQTKLFQIVDARWSWQRETLCTTNLEPDELQAEGRLGPRTVSRLLGMCRAVAMSGGDRRLRQAAGRAEL